MSGYLKYYAAENARHRDIAAVRWTFPQCVDAVNALCDHLKLQRIPVKLRVSRKQKSWYDTGKRMLTLHATMLTPLTVAHEVAHYQDHMFRLAQKDKKNERFAAEIASGKMHKFGIDSKTRWHGHRHLVMTNRAAAFVKKLPFYVPFKATRMENIRNWSHGGRATPGAIITFAFNALPNFLHCPKCEQNKHKIEFGMRVMARDPVTKMPTKVVRQSYCRKCRSIVPS